ncbi:MAG: undecaprenyldiphospho-muramoylpentapeptide beta-N-acetylglucosaminyltransferase [Candidatus Eisenbacteria bacterium]|uniref:UDP-N-acetylglucosamine--N-acetylmuramyl-(pentapeptide) pyrophosphoryl-undecaprenol N-acetylglucosamine transferase n=1 Tax=Eiseniibacteriota bacterium TaxID=2212470 RepID=A0A933SGC9_UNCEI|nr:undecaprenyldiphospho-muramoylpentapeptide beta-N-acetylglucosaminyltransferase [Candidatus Eisenbacteria bacterium]
MKILIAGGGTGGHVFPGIAVAEELRRSRPDCEIVFAGTRRGLESQAVPEAGFTIRYLAGSGFNRRRWWTWPIAAITNLVGVLQALLLVLTENPQVVLGTGGYVSAPISFAAKLLGRPLILQEQNSRPGLANRLLSRIADEVHLSFLEARSDFPRKDHLKVTGNPVRAHILAGDSDAAMREFELDPSRPVVFVFGGSLGAQRINEAAIETMRQLQGRVSLQLILQTGRADFDRVKAIVEAEKLPARVLPFVKKIHMAYAAADLVVCRAGAMTLAEIAVCGLPAILVPYPYAAHNHQEENATNLVDRGAAVMILDAELTGDRLAREVAHLLADKQALSRMSANARLFARPDAASRLAKTLLRRAEGKPEVVEESPVEGGQ